MHRIDVLNHLLAISYIYAYLMLTDVFFTDSDFDGISTASDTMNIQQDETVIYREVSGWLLLAIIGISLCLGLFDLIKKSYNYFKLKVKIFLKLRDLKKTLNQEIVDIREAQKNLKSDDQLIDNSELKNEINSLLN